MCIREKLSILQTNRYTARRSRKRKPGDLIAKHCSNKHRCAGLDSIPDAMKSACFSSVPKNIKVDLFNSIITTAFPNFDNLMIAAWNVVSIYAAVGTHFPDLHKAVVELKHVLDDFDDNFGTEVNCGVLRYRADLDCHARNGSSLLLTSTSKATQTETKIVGQVDGETMDRPIDLRDDARVISQQRQDMSWSSLQSSLSNQQASGPTPNSPYAPCPQEISNRLATKPRDQPETDDEEARTTSSSVHSHHLTPELARRRLAYAVSMSKSNARVATAKHLSDNASPSPKASPNQSSFFHPNAPTHKKEKIPPDNHRTKQLHRSHATHRANVMRTNTNGSKAPARRYEGMQLQQRDRIVRAGESEN